MVKDRPKFKSVMKVSFTGECGEERHAKLTTIRDCCGLASGRYEPSESAPRVSRNPHIMLMASLFQRYSTLRFKVTYIRRFKMRITLVDCYAKHGP